MFEVLMYLFETFYAAETYPDQETITRKLTQAGFRNSQISEALEWLGQLASESDIASAMCLPPGPGATRIYARSELAKISTAARGFLLFLENAGVLTAPLRELIIEHAMSAALERVDLGDIKVVTLMVLWTQEGSVDTLVLDELLPNGEPRNLH